MYRSTPISSKRTMDDRASFVCREEKTMWPVMAARTEMDAVSASRVSPTMMTSGSWRSRARQAALEGQARHVVHLGLVDAVQVALHGVLNGGNVHLPLGDLLQHHVQRGGLAAAGGAGQVDEPLGRSSSGRNRL